MTGDRSEGLLIVDDADGTRFQGNASL